MKDVKPLLDGWSKRPVLSGKSFDDRFRLDGEIPLWFLVKTLFYPEIFPQIISPYTKDTSAFSRFRRQMLRPLLREAIYFRERRKNLAFSGTPFSPDGQPKILFLSYTNHLLESDKIFRFQNMIDEVSRQEKETGIKAFPLFADPLSSGDHRRLEGRHTIYQYFTPEAHSLAKAESSRLSEAFWAIPEGKKTAMLRWEGESWWPALKPAFSFAFSKEILYLAVLYYELFKRAITEDCIKASIVSGAESIFERCLAGASGRLKVPCVLMQHGFALRPSYKPGQLDYFAKYFVMSGYEKRRLEESGFSGSFLKVPGPIIFDEIAQFKGKKRKNDPKKVLVATSPFPEAGLMEKKGYFRVVREMLMAMKELGVTGYVKLHPREKHLSEYTRICREIGYEDCSFYQHISRDDYFRLVSECDSFIHFGSTAALEAMILGKPIIALHLIDLDNNILQENDISIRIRPDDDIGEAILRSFRDDEGYQEKREAFLNTYFDKIDGKAGIRAAGLLIGLAKGVS